MILSGLAILAVIALIIMVTSFARRPAQNEFAYAGSSEFDSYVSNVLINNLEKRTGERITGRYALMKCTVQNGGDKVLIGLQLKATVLRTGGALIREKIVTPIPHTKESLDPNQSMKIEVSLEGVPDASEIMDMTIEVHGLKVK